jgi:hypothetical protein
MRRVIAIVGVSFGMIACGGPVVDPPYAGLGKLSFGPLVKYRDRATGGAMDPPSCSPGAQYQDVEAISKGITAVIARPFQTMGKTDPAIAQEGLQGQFRIYSDPINPPVAILHRDRGEIVFWYGGEVVDLGEVANAATKYCARLGGTASYEGSARKCGELKPLPVAINGQQTMMRETQIISAFQCSGTSTVDTD